ncbi:MarR family winged helix-turn-helix transcriptional regulator [Amycolatopsis sp. cg5]|uniref:MarR family winged helix-turn-helix transcriptional regulator n=1 Tax=Amycolatopsis sp. cg5 TaxID=3238802 RepID=UPI0035247E18
MADHVDFIVQQWAEQRPDVDVSPMAVIGRLKRLWQLVDAELRQTFKEHDLDSASFDVLATLRRGGTPLSPTELMKASMVTSGAVTQRLDKLEARGLVVRAERASDGRGVQVELTPEGLALIDRALPDHLATETRLLSALSGTEFDELVGTLRKLLESLGDVRG